MTVCAIYVHKSSEENLERNLNDPNIQRFICEKYVKDKGWELAPKKYDDIGYSGDTLKRPALKELLQDVENGKIDCVVVYRLECLSISFSDFREVKKSFFVKHGVGFIPVIQLFGTTETMLDYMLSSILLFTGIERALAEQVMEDKAAYEANLKVSANV